MNHGGPPADLFARGEAIYTDDQPLPGDALFAAIGTSDCAYGRITGIDLQHVREAAGVVDVICAQDIPGQNLCGPVHEDDPIFAAETVEYVGQSLFAVVATSQVAARRAAQLASVNYEPYPAVVDVDAAIAAGSRLREPVVIARGDVDRALARSDHQIAGTLRMGGQDHFYLEGQVAIATSTEGGETRILSSTQNPAEVQRLAAAALGVAINQVSVQCARMGGAFGGKETQAALYACVAALASHRTGKTVKIRARRDEDMRSTGKRHDVKVDYQAGFTDDGSILALDAQLHLRCGRSFDLSEAVLTRALLHCDNAYFLPNLRLRGELWKTHSVSNTAFRGFGGPQAILFIEHVVDEIAQRLRLDPLTVRKRNFYGAAPRNRTHYGMALRDNVLDRLVGELENTSDYYARLEGIERFNSQHRALKRGIALTPVKFGISFTQAHLNQAGALLHIYTDGSLVLSHGGTEMGQGLQEKVALVVAHTFGIDVARIRTAPTDTVMVPNSSPTAASASSDLNGMAAANAARVLKRRLLEFAARHYQVPPTALVLEEDALQLPDRRIRFEELVQTAYQSRISLSATGFYATPDLAFDPGTMQGRPFYYFVYGAAVCEAVVDVLTGESRIDRVDILQDVGRSLQLETDRGQIEGAFVQGLGWLTCEELHWDDRGALTTLGPSTYKIPTSYEWPRKFNVNLADWSENTEATILRSKGIGEPPLMLASAAFMAIRHALSHLSDAPLPVLHAPATPQEILRVIAELQRVSA